MQNLFKETCFLFIDLEVGYLYWSSTFYSSSKPLYSLGQLPMPGLWAAPVLHHIRISQHYLYCFFFTRKLPQTWHIFKPYSATAI